MNVSKIYPQAQSINWEIPVLLKLEIRESGITKNIKAKAPTEVHVFFVYATTECARQMCRGCKTLWESLKNEVGEKKISSSHKGIIKLLNISVLIVLHARV